MPNPTCPEETLLALLPCVGEVAEQLLRTLPSHVNPDDLQGAGIDGLLAAAEKWDPNSAETFRAYARMRIRGEMIDFLRAEDHVSRYHRLRGKLIEAARIRLRDAGRPATRTALADELSISVSTLERWQARAGDEPPLRLDALSPISGDPVHDTVATDLPSPDEVLLREDTLAALLREVAHLPPRERQAIQLYYLEDRPGAEVARIMRCTPANVSLRAKKALRRLRQRLGARGISSPC